MRYVMYATPGAAPRPGVLVDDERIQPFAASVSTLDAFVRLAPDQRAAAAAALEPAIGRAGVTLLAPLRPVKNVFCVGRNYLAHAEEGAHAQGIALDLPPVPTFFTKAPTAIAGPGQTIDLSARLSKQYDWEAELAVVIGSRTTDATTANAMNSVFGYMCLNDVTARDLQRSHVQWFKGKTLDNSCPIGPWLVDAAGVGDPQALDIELRVNGVVKQHSNTRNMIFPIADVIASLSAGLTLEPGDIIASGTPEGVGYARTPPEFFANGDVVEVEIARVGTLQNTIRLTA